MTRMYAIKQDSEHHTSRIISDNEIRIAKAVPFVTNRCDSVQFVNKSSYALIGGSVLATLGLTVMSF